MNTLSSPHGNGGLVLDNHMSIQVAADTLATISNTSEGSYAKVKSKASRSARCGWSISPHWMPI
jgi:hypothetical protein